MQQLLRHVTRNWIVYTIAFIAVVYVLTIKSFTGTFDYTSPASLKQFQNNPPFETSMERGRYMQIISLAEFGTFAVDRFRDFLMPDLAWYNGHYYPAFPPGVATVSVPGYLIGKLYGLSHLFASWTTSVVALCTGILIILSVLRLGLSRKSAFIAAVGYCLGSVAFPYSVSISAHPYSACVAAFLVFIYLRMQNKEHVCLNLFLAYISFGLNFFIDYPNLLITAPLLLAVSVRALGFRNSGVKIGRILGCALAGLMLILIPYVLYNVIHYGKPIAFTNTYNLKRLEIQGVKFDRNQLTNSLFSQKTYAGRFDLQHTVRGIQVLLFSFDRGLFVYSPVYLFAAIGAWVLYQKHKGLVLSIIASFAADILIYGSFDDPWGGWGFGPRYVIVILPLLAILVSAAYERIVSTQLFIRVLFSLTFLYSIGIGLLGALTTNAIPPSVEAVGLMMKDNFLYSFDYLVDGRISSFAYSVFFGKFLLPAEYGYLLIIFISSIVLSVMWIANRRVLLRFWRTAIP